MKISYRHAFLAGLTMGAADIVPGVSGGTMAWITGVYEKLIGSVSNINSHSIQLLLKGEFRAFSKEIELPFLLALGSGVATSMLLLAHLIFTLLQDPTNRTYLYGGFTGLILASILFCVKLVPKWDLSNITALLFGLLAAATLTLTPTQSTDTYHLTLAGGEQFEVSPSQVGAMIAKKAIDGDHQLTRDGSTYRAAEIAVYRRGIDPWAVFCGCLASSAMLLPGVSGAYLLQILGMYSLAIAALADFTGGLKTGTFDLDALLLLGSLFIGIAFGVLFFSRLINWLLTHWHEVAVAAICGFMIGAMGAVWPFWSTKVMLNPLKLEEGALLVPLSPHFPHLADPTTWITFAIAVAGFCLVTGLELIASRPTTESTSTS